MNERTGLADEQSLRSRIVADRIADASFADLARKYGTSVPQIRAYCRRAITKGEATRFQLHMRGPGSVPVLPDDEYDRRYIERLRARTVIAENGCWVWQGPIGSKGYIMLPHRKWRVNGHRNAFKILKKVDLATNQLVCHSCDNRRCWNIEHLWIGAPAKNSLDMVQKGRCHEWSVTHCPQGHEYSAENTNWKVAKSGRPARECKKCRLDRQAQYRLKNVEKYRERRRAAYAKRKESSYV